MLAAPSGALGHGVEIHGLADLAHAYTIDAWVLLPMTTLAVLYVRGYVTLARHAQRARAAVRARAAAFAGGMLALALALIWPLDALAGAALSAHMAQHVMMTAVAAPLLVASAPLVTGLWALPAPWRHAVGSLGRRFVLGDSRNLLTLPVVAWGFYTAMLWTWHMPGPYQAALADDALHTLEHAAFLLGALLVWWAVLQSVRATSFGLGTGVFLLFATGLQEGLLGALLTFSNRTLYPAYEAAPGLWGISALEDQQLAGVLMWVPGGAIYLCGALMLTRRLLARIAAADQRPSYPGR